MGEPEDRTRDQLGFAYPTGAPHHTGPGARDTEAEAAASQTASKVTALQRRVLDALAERWLTAEELAEALDVYLYTVAPRVTELCRLGLVADSGERRLTGRKRRAIVWRRL